jgi:5-deoxy-glucuronate isomerase
MVSGAGCEVVLIPHGYHPCRARNGFEMYFLKIMVGPLGKWRFIPAPEVEWIMGENS